MAAARTAITRRAMKTKNYWFCFFTMEAFVLSVLHILWGIFAIARRSSPKLYSIAASEKMWHKLIRAIFPNSYQKHHFL